MRLKKEQAFAIIIDYQERLLPVMLELESLMDRSVRFLNGLRALEIPMLLSQQYTKGLGMTVEEIREAAGTEEYVEKLSYSAYPVMEEQLPSSDEKPFVLICGVESHICVLQTAIELKEKGYQPVLITDCVSSRRQEDKQIALERAKQEGILLSTYEAVLFELLGAAGTAEAKAIQKIVK